MPTVGPELEDALAGSACLGTWAYDGPADRFVPSPALARLLGSPRTGIALARVAAAVHRDDRDRVTILLRTAGEEDGRFEAEFRLVGEGRSPRWLRLMGRADRGTGTACGLAFDLSEGWAARGGPARQIRARINRMAEDAIAAKGLLADWPDRLLVLALDRAAVAIGFALARCLRDADEPRH